RGGARHVEGGVRPRRAHHAEVGEELLRHVEVRRAEPPVRQVRHLDQCHRSVLLFSDARYARPSGRQTPAGSSGQLPVILIRWILPKTAPTLPRDPSGVHEGSTTGREAESARRSTPRHHYYHRAQARLKRSTERAVLSAI